MGGYEIIEAPRGSWVGVVYACRPNPPPPNVGRKKAFSDQRSCFVGQSSAAPTARGQLAGAAASLAGWPPNTIDGMGGTAAWVGVIQTSLNTANLSP